MIDYLTDIKQAISSNNPYFTVQNEHNVETLISTYDSSNVSVL
jgi:hypothetical protein